MAPAEAAIEVFSGRNCAFCERAKALLGARGYAYREYDVTVAEEHRADLLRRLPRVRALPQIFVGGQHIGSFDDLEILERDGRLAAMLGSVG